MTRTGNWQTEPGGYRTFRPNPLPPDPPVKVAGKLQVLLSQADMALARLDGTCRILPNPDLFVATYVRKEAVLSSQIENTQSSLSDLFEYEAGGPEKPKDVREVVNYVKAMDYGLKRLETLPLSCRLLKEIHHVLLSGVRGGQRQPGDFRDMQNWIGPGGGVHDAVFIPPPANLVPELMGQLEKFLNYDQAMPELVKAALAHYQFETIHPFLDGNGRLGRLLITFYLTWKKILHRPLLYLSLYFKQHRQQYYDKLMAVRLEGNFETWTEFFLQAVTETSKQALETAGKILKLQEKHRRRLMKSGTSISALKLLDLLYTNPIVTANSVKQDLHISYSASYSLLRTFRELQILSLRGPQQRNKRYVYIKLLKILTEGM